MLLVIWTIKEDVENRINIEFLEIERNNAICLKEYKENQCEPENRIPVLENFCNEKEKCFHRNAHTEIGKTRTTITVLIEIINEIFARLTWSSLFGLILVYVSIITTFKLIMQIGKTSK